MSIRRDGKRWLVLRGWQILASFPTKEEALAYIEWAKTTTLQPKGGAA